MKSIDAILIATALFLASVTVVGAYFYQPRLETVGGIGMLVLPSDIYEHPEQAIGLGFRGVIKIEFMGQIPQRVFVTKNQPQNFTFTMTFISFRDILGEIDVELGSKDTDVGYMGSMIGDYRAYSPSGNMTLKAGEVREAHMILSVPSSLDHGMSFPRRLLGGAGISSEKGILIINNLMNDPYIG